MLTMKLKCLWNLFYSGAIKDSKHILELFRPNPCLHSPRKVLLKLAYIKWLLCAKHFTYIILFNPHNTPVGYISISSFCRWRNWGSREVKYQKQSSTASKWLREKFVPSFNLTELPMIYSQESLPSLLVLLVFWFRSGPCRSPFADLELAGNHFLPYLMQKHPFQDTSCRDTEAVIFLLRMG